MKTEEQILSKAESLEKQLITLLTDELERNEKKQKEMQNMTLEVFLAQLIHGKTFIEFIDLIQKAKPFSDCASDERFIHRAACPAAFPARLRPVVRPPHLHGCRPY